MNEESGTALADPETETDSIEAVEVDVEQLCDLEREHYDQIRSLEGEAYTAEEEFDVANSEAKVAKKIWEGKVERLRQLIRFGPDPQRSLPFGDDENPAEAWRIVAIDTVIEATDKQLEKLQESGILTVEHFENLRAGEGLTSLTGIGQATAEKWEEQMLDWMAVNAREGELDEDFEAGTGDDIPSDPDSE